MCHLVVIFVTFFLCEKRSKDGQTSWNCGNFLAYDMFSVFVAAHLNPPHHHHFLAHSSTLLSQHGPARWQLLRNKTTLEQHKYFLKQRGRKRSSPLLKDLIQIRERKQRGKVIFNSKVHSGIFAGSYQTKTITSIPKDDSSWILSTKKQSGVCKHTSLFLQISLKSQMLQLPDWKTKNSLF